MRRLGYHILNAEGYFWGKIDAYMYEEGDKLFME